MTLAFSTQLNKVPTYFVEKILKGLEVHKLITFKEILEYWDKDIVYYTNNNVAFVKQKIHTIRTDEKNRWKAGIDIHFVINNRTKNRYQFAPIIKCVSTQKISITYWYNKKTQLFDLPMIIIDNKVQTENQIEMLALNDGFDNSVEFFKYFNTNFEGVLIHWTNHKY